MYKYGGNANRNSLDDGRVNFSQTQSFVDGILGGSVISSEILNKKFPLSRLS